MIQEKFNDHPICLKCAYLPHFNSNLQTIWITRLLTSPVLKSYVVFPKTTLGISPKYITKLECVVVRFWVLNFCVNLIAFA